MKAALAAMALGSSVMLADYYVTNGDMMQAGVVPDPKITPGEAASTDEAEVCGFVDGRSYSQRHRLSQNPATKRQVLSRYGVEWTSRALYEDDHNLPLALGGSDSIANRWPQPRYGAWNAGLKDALETRAWEMVCHEHYRDPKTGLALEDAQALFLAPADWRVSYCRIIGGGDPCLVK